MHLFTLGGPQHAAQSAGPGHAGWALLRWLAGGLLWLALGVAAHAQSVLDGFNAQASGEVLGLAVQPDGKVLVGGAFTSIHGQARNRIARLNADGSLDTSFNPGTGANDRVNRLAVQPDGKVLVGGLFTSIHGQARSRIARLNADGSLDTTFNPGTGANDRVTSLAVQPDGKVLVGGQFTTINGTARSRIARLNADGALDTTFDPGTGTNGTVYSLAVQPDGKVLVVGTFTSINGTARNRIARLNADGALDTTFNPGAGANSSVNSLAVQPDGKVLVGGLFSDINGQARNRIARLGLPEAALQALAVNAAGNGVRWLRSGTGPALERVRFFTASVPNATGAALTLLGEGQFVDGAWAWSGAALPTHTALWLHAEGVASSGAYNGSGSLYRAERMVYRSTVHLPAAALPAGTQGLAYGNTPLSVGNTLAPAFYAVAAGSSLPPGLVLDPLTGAISGTPTTPGVYSFTLSATNASGTTWLVTGTVTVVAAAGGGGAVAGPVAIPVDAPWALVLAAAALALLAWRQQRSVR